jgi:hypothetical protein
MRIIQLVLFALLASNSLWAGNPKATALLKGVEQERSKYQCFRMCYTEHRAEPGAGMTVDQIVDFDHGKIRKEHLPNDLFYGMKGVLLDDVIYAMSTGYNKGDLTLVALHTVNASGADIYDPRLLGLTDMMSHRHPLREVIASYANKQWDVQQTTFKGKSMYLLTWKNENDDEEIWKVWVEEPSFRIYRIMTVADYGDIILESDYADSNRTPFPTTVKIFRKAGRGKIKNETVFDRTITVTQFEPKESFPPETFTYAGMNLPLNTAVVDYRIQRRLGYWDGEKLVDDPVRISAQEHRELMKKIEKMEKKDTMPLHRIIGIGIGIVMILLVIYLRIRSKRK